MSHNHIYGLTVKVLPRTNTKGTRYKATYNNPLTGKAVTATVGMCYANHANSELEAATLCAAKVGKVVFGNPIMVSENCVVYGLAAK